MAGLDPAISVKWHQIPGSSPGMTIGVIELQTDFALEPSGAHRLVAAGEFAGALEQRLRLGRGEGLRRRRAPDAATARRGQRQYRCGMRVRHLRDDDEVVLP